MIGAPLSTKTYFVIFSVKFQNIIIEKQFVLIREIRGCLSNYDFKKKSVK